MVTTNHHKVFQSLSAGFSGLLNTLQEVGNLECTTENAEVEVLKRVVHNVLPVIKYLDRDVETKASWSNHYEVSDYEADYLRERAISLVGGRIEERASADADADTVYGGHELVLTRTGKFLELRYEGRCSQYQSGGGGWKAVYRHMPIFWTVRNYGLAVVANGLHRVLREGLEKLDERKWSLQRRLEFIERVLEK